jgi:hypothetical protein
VASPVERPHIFLAAPRRDRLTTSTIRTSNSYNMSGSFSLPQTEAHVEISILDGGGMVGLLKPFHEGQEGDLPMSSWTIYIHHPPSGRHLLWDVGLDMVFYVQGNLTGRAETNTPKPPKTFTIGVKHMVRKQGPWENN